MKSFRLNGKPFSPTPEPRAVGVIRAVLDKLPDGDLLSSNDAAAKTGYTGPSFNQYKTQPGLAAYRAAIRFPTRSLVWGNPKTISELRKQKEILA